MFRLQHLTFIGTLTATYLQVYLKKIYDLQSNKYENWVLPLNDLFQYVWNAVIFLVRCLWTQINYTMSNIFTVKTVIFTKKLDYDIIQSVRQPPCNDKICNSNYIIKRFLSRSLSPFSVIKALHFRMRFFVADYWEIHSRIKIPE